MNIKDFSQKPQSIIFGCAICGLFSFSLGQFIASYIWIYRTMPYFSKFDSFDNVTYLVNHDFKFSFGFSFINCLYILSIVIFGICLGCRCCFSIFKNTGGIMTCFLFEIGVIVFIIYFGFKSSFHSFKNGKLLDNRCYNYLSNSFYEMDKIFSDDVDYHIWKEKLMAKIFDEKGHLTSYLCEEIGIPIFIFSILHIVCFILLSISIFCAWKNPMLESDKTVEYKQPLNEVVPLEPIYQLPITPRDVFDDGPPKESFKIPQKSPQKKRSFAFFMFEEEK